MRAAFGLSGQKCSANSRVYVERAGLRRVPAHCSVDKTQAITIGDPLERQNWMGPVINADGHRSIRSAVAEARAGGHASSRAASG